LFVKSKKIIIKEITFDIERNQIPCVKVNNKLKHNIAGAQIFLPLI